MARAVVAQHDDHDAVARLTEAVESLNPGYHVSAGVWTGEGELASRQGGVRYLWLVDGDGEVFLPAGYRTQEGDGEPLPPSYRSTLLPAGGQKALEDLGAALHEQAVHPDLAVPLMRIYMRARDGVYRGMIAGDIWLMLESKLPPLEWVKTQPGRKALGWFIQNAARIGWSIKTEAGPEAIQAGDQLIATPAAPLRVRGHFRYWAIEDTGSKEAHCSAVRRLRYLQDTAGGCGPGFDAFRRLNLTWHLPPAEAQRLIAQLLENEAAASGMTAPDPDAPNRLNSHVVHIEATQSRAHYHPAVPIGGGRPQSEFYFSLDPYAYRLRRPREAEPRLLIFPDVTDWGNYETVPLPLGAAVFIPPDTGHRGLDAFVNVVTIPGFKPRNELYAPAHYAVAGSQKVLG
jgi:hypothetical protein